MYGSHMVALMIIGGRTNHPSCVSIGCSIAYLFILQVVGASGDMTLQYVNYWIRTLRLRWDLNEGLASSGAHVIHRMCNLNPKGQVHLGR